MAVVSYGNDIEYVVWASISGVSCVTMGVCFCTWPETRKLPGKFIIYRALCELAFSLSLIGHYIGWISCDTSGLINMVAQTGSNLWIVVMCFDLTLTVRNPFDIRTFYKRYHTFVWVLAAAPAIVSSVKDMVGQNQLGFCWLKLEGPDDDTDYSRNVYRWALVYVPCFTCLVATAMMMALVRNKLHYGLQLSHVERRRVVLHGNQYVKLFCGYWLLLGACYFAACVTHPSSGIQLQIWQHTFPVLIGGHGFMIFLAWLRVHRIWRCANCSAATESITPASPVALIPYNEKDAWLSKGITEQLRRELVHLTAIGIFHGASRVEEASGPWPQIFHSCNVISEHQSGCCGLPVTELAVEAQRGLELQSKCTFYDYAPEHFALLRKGLNVDSASYQGAFLDWEDGCEGLRERLSEGASGSFLYFTQDRRFVVKTVERSEVEALVQMLPKLNEHVDSHGSTLIHYYGAHAIRLPLHTSRIFFVVMRNIFHVPSILAMRTPAVIRRAPTAEIFQRTPAASTGSPRRTNRPAITTYDLKGALFLREASPESKTKLDMDWVAGPSSALGQAPLGVREAMAARILKDAALLKQHNRVDYSLLLGDLLCPSTPPDELQGEYTIVSGNHVYCFGIVDALDKYHCGWWCQGVLLSGVLTLSCHDPSTITAVNAATYADRFEKFLIEQVLGLDSSTVSSNVRQSDTKPTRTTLVRSSTVYSNSETSPLSHDQWAAKAEQPEPAPGEELLLPHNHSQVV